MSVQVEFIKDFVKKKKGDTGVYDGHHAHHLVKVDKVAKYVTTAKEVKTEKPKAKSKK
jgi:hypothetical protein